MRWIEVDFERIPDHVLTERTVKQFTTAISEVPR